MINRTHFRQYHIPAVCQLELLLENVLPYFTHCMKVAYDGIRGNCSPNKSGPKPVKCFFLANKE